MSVFKRCESEPPPLDSLVSAAEDDDDDDDDEDDEDDDDDDDDRWVGVLCIERKGDMRSAPVRAPRVPRVVEDVRGRMGRATARGMIVRKRVKRGNIRLIVTRGVVVVSTFPFF
jgi:hypothetical protein